MICEVGLEVVYLLLFLPNEFGGPRRLLWGSGSGRIEHKRPRGVEMAYEQTPARTHAPIGARATLVV